MLISKEALIILTSLGITFISKLKEIRKLVITIISNTSKATYLIIGIIKIILIVVL